MYGRFANRLTWEEIIRLYRLTIQAPPHNLPVETSRFVELFNHYSGGESLRGTSLIDRMLPLDECRADVPGDPTGAGPPGEVATSSPAGPRSYRSQTTAPLTRCECEVQGGRSAGGQLQGIAGHYRGPDRAGWRSGETMTSPIGASTNAKAALARFERISKVRSEACRLADSGPQTGSIRLWYMVLSFVRSKRCALDRRFR
jgi:hypothetical protein